MTFRGQIIAAIVLGLIAGLVGFCYAYPLVRVTGYRLTVDDETVGTGAEYVFADTARDNLFRQSLDDYAEAILEDHPELSSVTCRISLDGEIVCDGSRKKPIAFISLPEVFGVSGRGEILPLDMCEDVAHIPIITGFRAEDATPFETISSREVHEALEICKLLRTNYRHLESEISEIDVGPGCPPTLHLRTSGVRIIIGYSNYDEKLHVLMRLIDRIRTMPANVLDLRFGRSVVASDLT
jgi:hypothetical protein